MNQCPFLDKSNLIIFSHIGLNRIVSPDAASFGIMMIIPNRDVIITNMVPTPTVAMVTISVAAIVASYIMVVAVSTVTPVTTTIAAESIMRCRRGGGGGYFESPLNRSLHRLSILEQFHQPHSYANIHHVRLHGRTLYKDKKEKVKGYIFTYAGEW